MVAITYDRGGFMGVNRICWLVSSLSVSLSDKSLIDSSVLYWSESINGTLAASQVSQYM